MSKHAEGPRESTIFLPACCLPALKLNDRALCSMARMRMGRMRLSLGHFAITAAVVAIALRWYFEDLDRRSGYHGAAAFSLGTIGSWFGWPFLLWRASDGWGFPRELEAALAKRVVAAVQPAVPDGRVARVLPPRPDYADPAEWLALPGRFDPANIVPLAATSAAPGVDTAVPPAVPVGERGVAAVFFLVPTSKYVQSAGEGWNVGTRDPTSRYLCDGE